MTAKTHVLGSMSLALGGYILMDKGGLLIPDVEPLIQLGIILPYSVWASTVPDLDQAHDSVAQSSPINLLKKVRQLPDSLASDTKIVWIYGPLGSRYFVLLAAELEPTGKEVTDNDQKSE